MAYMWDLVPQPGIKPGPPALGARSLTHWTTRKVPTFLFYFIFKMYVCMYVWLRWVFIAACGLSLVVVSGGYSSFQCTGFSLWWLLLLWSTGSRRVGFSRCGSRALERRLSSCGARALLLRSMWDLPGTGLEPVSPALAGGFLTTVPPGKSLHFCFICKVNIQKK